MTLDVLDSKGLELNKINISEKLGSFHKSFDSNLKPTDGIYQKFNSSIDNNIARWLELDNVEITKSLQGDYFDTVKRMFSGVDSDGGKVLGLKDINKWKKNPDYYEQNLRQQAGYAAEVIGTAKENLQELNAGSGHKVFRADDYEGFGKNHQYVDKVIVDANNNILERIQVKFVGDTAEKSLSKLMSKDFDKYFNHGQVDKIEIPKDFYDKIKGENGLLEAKRNDLLKQLKATQERENLEAAAKIEQKLVRCDKIDEMLKRSTVSHDEARYATLHPERYSAKLFVKETVKVSHADGIQSGLSAAAITLAMTTVDNVKLVMNGEIKAQDAFVDIAKDTGTAGAVGYGAGFITNVVAQTMSQSSYELIRSLGNAGIPAVVVSFGIDSYDSVIDYSQGIIDGKELAVDLGENATGAIGALKGATLAGAALGSVVPGAGTAVGFAAGLVGGMVGYAVTTEVYQTAIELGSEGIEIISDKAQMLASDIVEMAEQNIPHKLNDIKTAMNTFASNNDLPFMV